MSEIVACTIITKSYLSYARTLAWSLKKHNQGATLYVLLADKLDNYFNPQEEPFKLIQLEELGNQKALEDMSFYYNAFEFCCALRGMLHEYIFENTSVDKWIFLDSDILVCHSLEEIFQQLDQSSILLCPHSTTPVKAEFVRHYEILLLQSGLYNAGFLGLRRTNETRKFISWFKDRLQFYGFDQRSEGQYVDQLWLNFVPILFQNVSLLLSPGANLAYWNLYERVIEEDEKGNITINGQPLLFYHFSRWKIEEPHKITTIEPVIEYDPILMYEGKEFPTISRLGEKYRDILINNGYQITKHYPYAFANFVSGEFIKNSIRHKYYISLIKNNIDNHYPFNNSYYLLSRLGERGMKANLRNLGKHLITNIRKILT